MRLEYRVVSLLLLLKISVDDSAASTPKKQIITSRLSKEYFKNLDITSSQNMYAMPRSCAEALSIDPSLQTGVYKIDPDGTIIGDDPIEVYCNMETGATLVSHDSEEIMDVGQCDSPGCYSRSVNYAGGATVKQLAALADFSTSCRQSITYNCFKHAPFEVNGVAQSWWDDRKGDARYFWAGANDNNEHTCQCGIDNNCHDPLKCNCDSLNLILQLIDSGFVTEKSLLPIIQLNFGNITIGANGKYILGKLECTGRMIVSTIPANCRDLFVKGNQISGLFLVIKDDEVYTVYCDFTQHPEDSKYETIIANNTAEILELQDTVVQLQDQITELKAQVEAIGKPVVGPMPTDCDGVQALGWTLSGFYTTKHPSNNKKIQTTYCDFTKSPGEANYEKRIGFHDLKTIATQENSGVYFFATRQSNYNSANSVITYDSIYLNYGYGVNIGTGGFTAPVTGIYYFSFAAQAGTAGTQVFLRKNTENLVSSEGTALRNMMSLSMTLNLNSGDKVDIYLETGSLSDDNTHKTFFSGFLIEEDIHF